MDRVVLNSSLRKISQGDDIEKSVKNAVIILEKLSNFAEGTLLFLRNRPNSDYLREQLSYDDLERVGNYICSRKRDKDYLTISFNDNIELIEFLFRKKDFNFTEEFSKLVEKNVNYNKEDIERISINMIERALAEGKAGSVSETLLGGKARTLDSYFFDRVSIIRSRPVSILGFEIPFIIKKQKEVVYKTKDNFQS